MNQAKRRGTIILTEGRSGSNWLGSLTKATGVLGNSEEWFARWAMPKRLKNGPMDDYISYMIDKASTQNGYFCVKIFPAHLHFFNLTFEKDLLGELLHRYDCNFILLERSDRLRQAISYARGIQTGKWKSNGKANQQECYNAEMIARCFFLISRSYDYWHTTISIRQLRTENFVYEDLISNPNSYIQCIADHARLKLNKVPETSLKIQRDEKTEDWLECFREDIRTLNIVNASTPQRQPRRDISNALRFFNGKAMKPYPYSY